MRDPSHPNWPHEGERTEDEQVANKWKWEYLEWLRGEKAGRKTPRVAKALEEYRTHREKAVSEATQKSNAAPLAALEEWYGGKLVAGVTTKDIQAIFDGMIAEGYKPQTMQTNLFAMSSFFNWVGGHNPTKGVVLPAHEEPDEIYAWSDADIRKLRKVADARGQRLMLELALNTGARISEWIALKWSDFDARSKTVRISRQFMRSAKAKRLKGKLARTAIVLPDFWPFYTDGDGYVLESAGRPLSSRQAAYAFEQLLRAAGLYGQQRGAHDARRTYGRLFLEAGGWMDELQRSLGHTSIVTTEKTYGAFQGSVAAQFGVARIYGEGRLRAMR